MIKFFRKIRQGLLRQNKFSSYLLYAIGEIMLVVIGILIALQLNTWNETKKNKKLEQGYYCRFLEDIRQDEIQIQELIVFTKQRVRASNELLGLLQEGKSMISSNSR